MSAEPRTDLGEFARFLKASWERRARSDCRDYYVATHPGWDRRERWDQQAESDLRALLLGLDPSWLSSVDVLEVGCGVGRLTVLLQPRVASYTGFDIAPGMLEEARRRVQGGRFFESDGLGVPAEARDRQYGLVLAHAVFIHCPRDVVQSLAASAFRQLARGGRFRFQLLADTEDGEGVGTVPDGLLEVADEETTAREVDEAVAVATEEIRELIDGDYFMGHSFRFAEARELVEGLEGAARLYRPNPLHIYADVVRT